MLNSEIVQFNVQRKAAIIAKSKFVGTPKIREQFVVRCDSKRPFDSKAINRHTGQFEKGVVVNFQDLSGNLIVWFASASTGELEVGKYYVVEGSVKDHMPSIKWGNQTLINRVKVIHEY